MARTIANRKTQVKNSATRLRGSLKKLSTVNGASINLSSRSDSDSPKDMAAAYLYALGCTVSSEEIDYSLLDDCRKENIENENIDQSKEMTRIRPKKSSAGNKFINTDDPFYELDDDLPERIKLVNASIEAAAAPNLTALALVMANMT
tara:strand:- start:216 stop:659 length:444 start_codon:yes stop_codon:yes gene_type:complete